MSILDTRRTDTFVMACRCGQPLRLQDCHRQEPPRYVPADCVVIRPICCLTCAGGVR